MRLGMGQRFYISKRQKIRIVLGLVLILFMLFIFIFAVGVRPVLGLWMEQHLHQVATNVISESVDAVISAQKMQDFVVINKNDNNSIQSLETNTQAVNLIKVKLVQEIQNRLETNRNGYMKIPFGSILKQELVAGYGPHIPIKVHTTGTVDVTIFDGFETAGINQTRHTIYLNVTLTTSVISASIEKSQVTEHQIPIIQTVIVGNTPSYYAASGEKFSSAVMQKNQFDTERYTNGKETN